MPTTDDYIKAIREKRDNKQSISLDFSKLPQGIDVTAIKSELSKGLPDAYKQAITNKTGLLKLNYSIIPISDIGTTPQSQKDTQMPAAYTSQPSVGLPTQMAQPQSPQQQAQQMQGAQGAQNWYNTLEQQKATPSIPASITPSTNQQFEVATEQSPDITNKIDIMTGQRALKIANIPSEMLQKAGENIINKIPDPQTKSVLANVLIGAPKELALTLNELASGLVSPGQVALTLGMSALGMPEGAIVGKELDAATGLSLKGFEGKIKIFKPAMDKVVDLSKKLGDTSYFDMPDIQGVLGEGKAMGELQSLQKMEKLGDVPAPEGAELKQVIKLQKQAAGDLREAYSGVKNSAIVKGRYIKDTITNLVPDKSDRQALFWIRESGEDINKLEDFLKTGAETKHTPEIERAIEILKKMGSSETQQTANYKTALGIVDKYYSEAGEVSQKMGTIKGTLENYTNRIYEPEAGSKYVSPDMRSLLKKSSVHGRERYYKTAFDAIKSGKSFATTDIGENLSIYNEELAKVNANKDLFNYLSKSGLGGWWHEGKAPEGWKKVGNLINTVVIKDNAGIPVKNAEGNVLTAIQHFYSPPGMADGLKALHEYSDPGGLLGTFQKWQGLVKTTNLSFSFFHHKALASQLLYRGDVGTLQSVTNMSKWLATDEFRNLEGYFAKSGGITTSISNNVDILRNITGKNEGLFDKVVNAPGVKQTLDIADKNGKYLFDTYQRYIKTMSFGRDLTNWIGKNPEATTENINNAAKQIASYTNKAYGGLNWEAMGISRKTLFTLRNILLAPDWFVSNMSMGYAALSGAKGDMTTVLARKHLAQGFLGSMMLTEYLNKAFTGHYTNKNTPGHEFDIELTPEIHVPLLVGGVYDLARLGKMTVQGGGPGAISFLTGKFAPGLRTGLGLATDTKYTGVPITKRGETGLKKTVDEATYALQNMGPVPFSGSNMLDYIKHSQNPTVVGSLAVGTGLARYNKIKKKKVY